VAYLTTSAASVVVITHHALTALVRQTEARSLTALASVLIYRAISVMDGAMMARGAYI
jgi:hypothetical protein